MTVRIRPASADDLKILVDFNRRLAWETEKKMLDASLLEPGVRTMLADPTKGRYFVAEVDGVVVGQLGITLEWSDWRNGDFWWIQSVYVHAEHRRLGVFRALFEHVRSAALAAPNVIGIRLCVDKDNAVGQATYASLGMTTTHYDLLEIYPLVDRAST